MLKILNKLGLVKLFLLAILLRLVLMPFYFHPDIKTYNWQSSFLSRGVLNIYTFLSENKENLPLKEEFVYFPLTYLTLGTYQFLANPILGGGFNSWLSDASAEAVSKVGTFRYLFILKLPYLFLDLFIPFLLIRFLKDHKQQKEVFILWLFNPVSMAIIYFYSNIDIIPVTISLASLLLFREKKIFFAGIFLGLAAGFKPYPLILLPFMVLYLRSFKDKLKFISATVVPLLLSVGPFWSPAFMSSALISGLTTRLAFPSIPLGFGESLMLGIVTLAFIFFVFLMEQNKKIENSWIVIMGVFLILFSTIHFHIQWLLWVMPFFALYSVYAKLGKLSFLWLVLAFMIPLLYDDKSMTVSLFSAISQLYNLLPIPFLITQRVYDPFVLQGIIHSIIFAIALVISYKNYKYIKE